MSDRQSFIRRHWTDTLFGAAALFVSAVSLWVGIRTEQANEQLVAASSWPFLQIAINNATPEGVPYLKFNVTNAGVGPAKVESFEVFWRGKAYRSGRELLKDCCGLKSLGGPLRTDDDKRTRLLTGTVQGMVIRPGDSESFIMYPLHDDNTEVWNRLNDVAGQFTYRICYCSVLNDCSLSRLTGNMALRGQLHPEKVKVCPVPPVPYY